MIRLSVKVSFAGRESTFAAAIARNTGISEANSTDNPVSETPKARVKAICPSIEAIRRKSL